MSAHLRFAEASAWTADFIGGAPDLDVTRRERRYPRFERWLFPPETTPAAPPAGQRRSTRTFDGSGNLTLADLRRILEAVYPGPTGFAHASAGGLYAVETFLIPRRVDGCAPDGLLHVLRGETGLERLWDCPHVLSATFPAQTWVHEAALVIVIVALVAPYVSRYGERGYRFALLEAGAIAHELETRAARRGIGACALGGFVDSELASALDLDIACGEQPVLCLALGGSPDRGRSRA